MISNVLDRIAFWSLSLIIILLPVFLIPFSKIPAEASKALLIVGGLAISTIAWAAARFADGMVVIPRSKIFFGVFGVLLATLLSAIFSNNIAVSFFGVMFDVGTFWFMLAAVVFMFLASVIVKTKDQAKIILRGLLVSLSVLFVFQTFRYFIPTFLSLGVLGGKTSSLVGSWTTYGFIAALAATMTIYLLEFLRLRKIIRGALCALLVLSLFTIIVVNSSLVWGVFGAFSLLLFVYRIISATAVEGKTVKNFFPFYAFGSIIVALLFLLSGRFIGSLLPQALGLANIEISPSVDTTLQVGQDVLRSYPVFGIGANRFAEAWAYWKPSVINNTQFWDTVFNSGFGFIPTSAINGGTIGIAAWIVFLGMLCMTVFYAAVYSMKKKLPSDITFLFLIASLFLFAASFIYSFGIVGIMLAFAFLGVFTGVYTHSVQENVFKVNFLTDPRHSFIAILVLSLLMIGTAGLSFKFIERFASVPYFNGALFATNAKQAELLLDKALSLHTTDLYFRTQAQVQLANLSLLSQKEDLSSSERTDIQTSFDKAISSALNAIAYDSKNYVNHQLLGVVYTTVGRLGVEGASEKAVEAYQVASKLNPLNPGLKLSVATEYANAGKNTEALNVAEESLRLAPNYVDALLVLSQIERASGNLTKAKEYADRASLLNPNTRALNIETEKTSPAVNEKPPTPSKNEE
ncbi:MAG: tetratricopeptide repeat protein [Candidatus Paceibacterota bacterium]